MSNSGVEMSSTTTHRGPAIERSKANSSVMECPAQSSGSKAIQLWHEGMQLAELCYQATQMFPARRAYGLDAQIRMTASSIPASLAQCYEQAEAATPSGYADCIERARGALLELKSQLKFSERLALVTPLVNEMLLEECDVVGQRLEGLRHVA